MANDDRHSAMLGIFNDNKCGSTNTDLASKLKR